MVYFLTNLMLVNGMDCGSLSVRKVGSYLDEGMLDFGSFDC